MTSTHYTTKQQLQYPFNSNPSQYSSYSQQQQQSFLSTVVLPNDTLPQSKSLSMTRSSSSSSSSASSFSTRTTTTTEDTLSHCDSIPPLPLINTNNIKCNPLVSQTSPKSLRGLDLHSEFLNLYTPIADLGSGGFGFVVAVSRNSDGCIFACKFIDKSKSISGFAHDERLGRVPLEIYILKNVHPFLFFSLFYLCRISQ